MFISFNRVNLPEFCTKIGYETREETTNSIEVTTDRTTEGIWTDSFGPCAVGAHVSPSYVATRASLRMETMPIDADQNILRCKLRISMWNTGPMLNPTAIEKENSMLPWLLSEKIETTDRGNVHHEWGWGKEDKDLHACMIAESKWAKASLLARYVEESVLHWQ